MTAQRRRRYILSEALKTARSFDGVDCGATTTAGAAAILSLDNAVCRSVTFARRVRPASSHRDRDESVLFFSFSFVLYFFSRNEVCDRPPTPAVHGVTGTTIRPEFRNVSFPRPSPVARLHHSLLIHHHVRTCR